MVNENKENNENKSIYDRFDDGMMFLTNKYIQAYNWTTGRTKCDLANSILFGGTVCSQTGLVASAILSPEMAAFPAMNSILYFSTIHSEQKFNCEQQKLEDEALEKKCRSLIAEDINKKRKSHTKGHLLMMGFEGTVAFGSRPLHASCPGILPFIGSAILLGGLFTTSNYIMRAENLPPRKNVLARAWKKGKNIAKKLNEYPKPAIEGNPLPVPIENKITYSNNIGNYLPTKQENSAESEISLI